MSSTSTMESVRGFLAEKKLAVVGVSRNPQKFGSAVFRELSSKEYTVYPVNPNAEKIGEEKCYPSVKELPESVGGVVIVVPPAQTESVLREVAEAGINRVWIQRGAESDGAAAFCHERGIDAVTGQCILMFAEPVASFHKVHRFFHKLFGKMPADGR
jgi:uncharacterized protein